MPPPRFAPITAQSGFTLIEAMIASLIAAIVLVIAVPQFNSYVQRMRRNDAKSTLLLIQTLQERWRTSQASYASLAELGVKSISPDGHYAITVTDVTATSYVVTAKPAPGSSQVADKACPLLTLTQDGPDWSTSQAEQCWNR